MNLIYSGTYGLGGQEVPEVYKQHPQKAMRELGITYKHCVPQSVYDCWCFFRCENVPDPLPPFLSVMNCSVHELVGHGLTAKEAEELA